MSSVENSGSLHDDADRKLSALKLISGRYQDNDSHAVKLLSILIAMIKNGPVSKWELSEVSYRNSTKKGLTKFRWVLVHKLVMELLNLGLVYKHSKSNLQDGKSKKHIVDLYYPTQNGIVFSLCANYLLNRRVEDGRPDAFRFFNMTDDELRLLFALLDILWHIEGLNIKAGNEVRLNVMKKIIKEAKVQSPIRLILEGIIHYCFGIISQNASDSLNNDTKYMNDGIHKIVAIKSGLTSIKNNEVKIILAKALFPKISFMENNLRYMKWFYHDLGVSDPRVIMDYEKMERMSERIFQILTTYCDGKNLSRWRNEILKYVKEGIL